MTIQGSKNENKVVVCSGNGSGNPSGEHRENEGLPAASTNEGPAHAPADQRSCDSTEPDDKSFSSYSDDSSSSSIDTQIRMMNSIKYQKALSDPDDGHTWSPLHEGESPVSDVQSQGLLIETTVNKQSCDSTAIDEGSTHSSSSSSNDMKYRTSSGVQYRMVESDPEVSGSSPVVPAAGPPSRAHNIMWLLICFLGIMASFVSYGIVLEYATSGGRKLHELSFIFITSILGSLTAAAGRCIRHEVPSTIPSNRFIVLGAMSIGSTFCAIRALRYVIFPIQVLARSAKPVPVMLMGTVMGKRYPLLKYFYVVLIVLGVAIFIGGGNILKHDDIDEESETSTISSSQQQLIGILLLVTALFFDGTTGAYEDKLMSVHHVEPFDLMLKFQLSKTLLSGVVLLLFSQLDELFKMVRGTGLIIILLGMCSAIGQVFIFVTIAKFGALTCSLMSLTRKATTLAASIIIYGHSINAIQILGLCVGIGGMAMNTCNYGINGDAAGNSPYHYRVLRGLTISKRALFVSAALVFFIAMVTASQLWQVEEEDEPIRIPIDENAEPCTYDQLYETFGSAPVISNVDQCWKLSDRILRVSRSEILNFHNLIPLGHGNQSGVFKIFLELSNGKQCVAVYKTDLRNAGLCQDAWHHPFENWGHTKSCISAYMRPRKTTMPAEFTGALVFLAQQDANLDLPGLVPTWAIVPDIMRLKNTRRFLRWRHSSEKILGIIEPYLPIKRLVDVQAKVATSVINVERVMLPAAEGVAFINELGFAHQDILISGFKNVGFIENSKNESLAVVFDYGYIALDGKSEDCSLGRACDYCVEEFFPAPKMDDPIQYDLDNFRDITIALLKMSPNRVQAERMEKTLKACATMSELVAALKHSL